MKLQTKKPLLVFFLFGILSLGQAHWADLKVV